MEKQFYISKEQYAALIAAWKSRKAHSSMEHIIYNLLRSKPAKLGFVERKNNIQGNNSWYAYNEALKSAKILCSTKNPWAQCKDTPHSRSYESGEARIKENQKRFKETFGIDMPADFMDQLTGAQ